MDRCSQNDLPRTLHQAMSVVQRLGKHLTQIKRSIFHHDLDPQISRDIPLNTLYNSNTPTPILLGKENSLPVYLPFGEVRLVSFCIYLPTDSSLFFFCIRRGWIVHRLVLTNSEQSRQVMVPAAEDPVTKNVVIFYNPVTQGCIYESFIFFHISHIATVQEIH